MTTLTIPDESRDGPTLSFGDVKSGWCNSCTRRPPYEPNLTYQVRAKSIMLSFCPTCARSLALLFTDLIAREPK